MVINPDFVSKCGLYCGVCAIYIADRDNNVKLKEGLVNLYKGGTPGKGTLPNSESMTVDDIKCSGCLSDERFMHCQQCEIRDCIRDKGFYSCHQCDEWPCDRIENFALATGKRVMKGTIPIWKAKVAEHGDDEGSVEWARSVCQRYHCSACGNPLFRGAQRCRACGHDVSAELDGSL